jgi:hypothetical protein
MSNEDSEVSFKAGEGGIAIGAKGSGADRLTHGISDALSPFSEGLGYLGDVIRFYRQDTALRSIARAREIAKQLGITVNPVPPKFLVDWVEKASLESPDDPEITNLWAGLLVSAARSHSPNHYIFKRILSEMTREHVQFLAGFCAHDFLGDTPFQGATDFSAWSKLSEEKDATLAVKDIEVSLHKNFEEFENNRLRVRHYEIAKYSKFMLNKTVVDKKVNTGIDEYRKNYIIKFFIDNGIMSELVAFAKLKTPNFDETNAMIEINALHLTEFGVLFIESCQPSIEKTGRD